MSDGETRARARVDLSLEESLALVRAERCRVGDHLMSTRWPLPDSWAGELIASMGREGVYTGALADQTCLLCHHTIRRLRLWSVVEDQRRALRHDEPEQEGGDQVAEQREPDHILEWKL